MKLYFRLHLALISRSRSLSGESAKVFLIELAKERAVQVQRLAEEESRVSCFAQFWSLLIDVKVETKKKKKKKTENHPRESASIEGADRFIVPDVTRQR